MENNIKGEDGMTIQEFIDKLQTEFPDAKFEIVTSEEGKIFLKKMSKICIFSDIFVFTECFEFHINEKVVYSVRQLKDWPNFDELYEVTYWMHKVTSCKDQSIIYLTF